MTTLDAPPSAPASARGTRKRGRLAAGLAIGACAIACSIPLLAGTGALALGAGFWGGERLFFATALVGLTVAYAVWWNRRRRARQAAAAAHVQHDACQVGGGCAGSGCGC